VTLDIELLKRVQNALAELGSDLEKRNDVPSTAAVAALEGGTDDPGSRKFLEPSDRYALREVLRKKSTAELHAMFSVQARKKGVGIPFDVWAASGGQPTMQAISQDPVLTKALDTAGGTALIRQDLEPVMLELFIREFPAWERMRKEPANGLVHAYNRQTSFGDAQFMTELGTVTDDTSTYERATTPITILATRRGVTLKAQFAALHGGAGFNPEQMELQGGLRAIAHKMQKTIFQGNATVSSGTANDENGAYDPNSFDGLRKILNTNAAGDVDPTGGTPEDIRAAVNEAAITTMQAAGRADIIYLSPEVKGTWDLQLDKNVRYMNSWTEIAVGAQVNAVNTVFGPTPLYPVPGDSIGTYTRSGNTVSDMYLLDEDTISVPYLGSDGPTVLDIPIGVSGQLVHLFIIFGMWGFAVKAPAFSNKVRVKVA
jgi:hypothetical protein